MIAAAFALALSFVAPTAPKPPVYTIPRGEVPTEIKPATTVKPRGL